MVEDGLFDLFPCDHIFGLHNMPSQPLGKIGLRDGAMMASSDTLHIEVNGVGGHGAVPEHTVDATPLPVISLSRCSRLFRATLPPSSQPSLP